MRLVPSIAAFMLLFRLAQMPASSADTVVGSWSMHRVSQANSVAFLVRYDDPSGGSGDTSTDFDPADLGVASGALDRDGAKLALSLDREAGMLAGSGTVSSGVANGSFVFTPSAAYRAALEKRGYRDITARDQLRATMENVTIAFADEIAAAGYPHPSFDRLAGFRALHIDGPFIAAARAMFPDARLDEDQLFQLKALRVTQTYVAAIRDAGFPIASPQDAVQLRALDIDPRFLRDLAAAGYAHLSASALIELRALGIDGAYVQRVRAHGISHPTIDQLVRLRAMHIVDTLVRVAA